MKPIQIFRPGRHTPSGGDPLDFSEDQVSRIASGYDPAKHEAPLVVGHPKTDDPAFGWVKSLSFAGGVLVAEPDQLDAGFAEQIQAGRFKKISASFYKPDAPSNPTPGDYYLRHVGFLGAQPPAVKGLKAVAFAEADDEVVIFEEFEDNSVDGLAQRLLGLIVNAFEVQFGSRKADFAETALSKRLNGLIDKMEGGRPAIISRLATAAGIDAGTVNQILNGSISRPPDRRLQGFARVLGVSVESLKSTLPADDFSDPEDPTTSDEDSMTDQDLAAKTAAIKEQEAALKAREDAQAAKEAAFAEQARRQGADSFLEELVTAGTVLPAQKAGLVDFMAHLDDQEAVEFGEAEDGKAPAKSTPLAFFQDHLKGLPKAVEFKEVSKAKEGDGDTVNLADPVAISKEAKAFQKREAAEGRTITDREAVDHVTKQGG